MIEPMKKVVLLTLGSFKKETVSQLSDLGVVHVVSKEKTTEDLNIALQDKYQLEQALSSVEGLGSQSFVKAIAEKSPLFGLDLAKKIVNLTDDLKSLNEESRNLSLMKDDLSLWGDFSLSDWRALVDNLDLRMAKIPLEKKESLIKREDLSVIWIPLKQKPILGYPAILIPQKGSDFNWKKEEFDFFHPQIDLFMLEEKIKENNERIRLLETELKDLCKYREELEKSLVEQDYRVIFERVLAQGSLVKGVIYWEGYIPVDSIDKFKESSRKYGWAYSLSDPLPQDERVPTSLKLGKISSMLMPLYNLLGTYPGYKERDISIPFLAFFLVFVSFLIADAGYGLVYLLAGLALLINRKMQGLDMGDLTKLILSIGGFVTLWGTLTGGWFGSYLVEEVPFLKSLVLPSFRGDEESKQSLIISISLSIGFFQVLLAHIWNFFWEIKKKEFLRSITQIGWILMVLGVGWLVFSLVVDAEKFPLIPVVFKVILIGLLLVMIFHSQKRGVSFFKAFISGLGGVMEIILGSINTFSDIVSYIRLFAVGLSGAAIADSFNQLGSSLFNSGWGGILGGVIIIAMGQAMCFALGMLAMVVHGVRLNLLEFSSRLGQQWTGQPYQPFRNKIDYKM